MREFGVDMGRLVDLHAWGVKTGLQLRLSGWPAGAILLVNVVWVVVTEAVAVVKASHLWKIYRGPWRKQVACSLSAISLDHRPHLKRLDVSVRVGGECRRPSVRVPGEFEVITPKALINEFRARPGHLCLARGLVALVFATPDEIF